ANWIFERADVGARVVVEPAEERLPHGLSAAGDVPREAESRAHRLEVGNGCPDGRHGLEIRCLLWCEAVLGPPELIAIEPDAGVDREAFRETPSVLRVNSETGGIVGTRVR